MSSFKFTLNQLETRLQTLIEGSAARLFPDRTAPHRLIHSLLQAVQDSLQPVADGQLQAPNLYVLLVNPEDTNQLRQNQTFLDELAALLRQTCQEAGLRLSGPVSVRLESDASVAPGEIHVIARDSLQDLTPTSGVVLTYDASEHAPQNAFLIVDGVRVFPLDQPVINIGRRPDNQLVIDDPRVSRVHAQLRLAHGRFILFDLESTGGTWVNGQRIHQQTLHPGDVISLAGVPLVFSHDAAESDDTQQLSLSET
jgi:hypothetical protein